MIHSERKKEETKRRWVVAIKDANFDCIRNLPVAETQSASDSALLAVARTN